MNSWRSRFFLGAIYILVMIVHAKFTADFPNTPGWQLVYHGSASFSDFILLFASSNILTGRLSNDMQDLCLTSMFINAIGWFAYLAWISSTPYNFLINGLSCVQFFRLFIVDAINDHSHTWRNVFRWHHPIGKGLYNEKAEQ